jgi:hypothetical protein
MYMNPMWKKPVPKKSSLSICCVLDELFYTDSRISDIRSYAQSLGISFTLREYDAFNISADRKYVERLPAFHIYIDHHRHKTIYLDSEVRPEEQIDYYVHLCLEREEKKKLGFLAWIRSLFQKSHGRSRAILRSK